ncbi:hypothetical protein HNW13_018160 [Shewanella sp. BF02_Schw]|uniref:DotH/IcmK family type IV secretion protein n=1 Tax=Shewanella sp. BF02_Schw TaxID=394908 RepID=UPI00177CA082|nr:DotH/IcmK family type IV secretion protein [Shewanella sp. BF02_Schw]MBO1897665.1 hypothetical protein [Shewanella sp. BF02_Schw]
MKVIKCTALLLTLLATGVSTVAVSGQAQPTSDVVLPEEVELKPISSVGGQSVNSTETAIAIKKNDNPDTNENVEYPVAEFSDDGEIHAEALKVLFSNMNPDAIRQVKLMSELMLEAQSSQVTPLDPSQNVFVLSLSPGGRPPTIRTREGFNTVISFLDTLGKPWPIEWSLPGNDAYEEIDSQGDKPVTHTIVLNAKAKYETTNYTVKLLGLDDPLMFILLNTIHGKTDFKITYKIPKIGPNTQYESATGIGTRGASSSTNSILDINMDELDQFFANPPAKANVIPVSLPQVASVWFYNGLFIVKTRHELAEDYERITYGPNGWKVYAIREIDYEMVVVTEDGMIQVSLPAELIHNYSKMDSK